MADEFLDRDEALRDKPQVGDLVMDLTEMRVALCTERTGGKLFLIFLDTLDEHSCGPDDAGIDVEHHSDLTKTRVVPRRLVRIKPAPEVLYRGIDRTAVACFPVSIKNPEYQDFRLAEPPSLEVGQVFSFSRDIHDASSGRCKDMELEIYDVLIEVAKDGNSFYTYVCGYKVPGLLHIGETVKFLEMVEADMEIIVSKELIRQARIRRQDHE